MSNNTAKNKQVLLDQLKKTPIIQVACEKCNVSRATFYRWRKDDNNFAEEADTALLDGAKLVNDLAESQLIAAIRNQNLTAIIFWLKNHHAAYANKLEVTTKNENPELTPEQEESIKNALLLAQLINPTNEEVQND